MLNLRPLDGSGLSRLLQLLMVTLNTLTLFRYLCGILATFLDGFLGPLFSSQFFLLRTLFVDDDEIFATVMHDLDDHDDFIFSPLNGHDNLYWMTNDN